MRVLRERPRKTDVKSLTHFQMVSLPRVAVLFILGKNNGVFFKNDYKPAV